MGFGILRAARVHEKANSDREIIVLKAADGSRYVMVVRANGSLAIARDGELLSDKHWNAADVDDCVKALYKSAGRAQPTS